MKRILLPLALMMLSLPSFGRVICDTACHAPEDEFKNFAVVSPVGRSMVARTNSDYNMRSLPEGVYLVRVAGIKGACKVIKK